jgi:uncharacterized DUF497 family protein
VSGIRFEWDEAKNLANQRKHGVDFDQASQVFLDPLHLSIPDRVVHGEERWQTFGLVKRSAILIVVHTIREFSADQGTEVVRIISAREATRKERVFYEEENG